MNPTIDLFKNLFLQRGIASREQILNELLRVKITERAANEMQSEPDIYDIMKNSSEDTILGYFPGDKDFFNLLFSAGKNIDLIEFACNIYQNDRLGSIIAPDYLDTYFLSLIKNMTPQTIMICEAERFLNCLTEITRSFPDSHITITTQNYLMRFMFEFLYSQSSNVTVVYQSIYQKLISKCMYDCIFTIPNFGGKIENFNDEAIENTSYGTAVENMLDMVGNSGILLTVLPARITFAGGADLRLRSLINDNFQVNNLYSLPDGIFKPFTSIKTFFLNIGREKANSVNVGHLGYSDKLFVTNEKAIASEEFITHQDWRIEMLLAEEDTELRKYKNTNIERKKLYEIAEVFRGKSILKKDMAPGKVFVINISNITDAGIDYEAMDNVDEDERKVRRYELLEGDVLLTCRGTALKVAVFNKQSKLIIASSNIIIIRPNEQVLSAYLKIFFESPVGIAIIKSIQRGTAVININQTDIMEVEVPLISLAEQRKLVEEYKSEAVIYSETITNAEQRFTSVKNKIYDKLV